MLSLQQNPTTLERRKSIIAGDADASQIRSEFMLQQRKFDRLEYKEKKIQVTNKHNAVFRLLDHLYYNNSLYTTSGKNGTASILRITLTKFNTFL